MALFTGDTLFMEMGRPTCVKKSAGGCMQTKREELAGMM
jgi:hypothetical protein